MRGRMGEADTIRGVWLSAMAIFRKYPVATLAPAAILCALGEIPAYFIDGRPLLDQILTLVTAYVAYYLYLAYAEGMVRKAQLGAQRLGLRGVLEDLFEATPFVPSVLVAALISLSITTVATGLLVIPGVWLYTRWSLATPVIREKGIGPLAATRRSNELVRGHFWFGFMTATVAYYLEGVVVHEGALVAGSVQGRTRGGMGGRLDRGDAGHSPGGLRYLLGPLQPGESDVTRCNRHQVPWRPGRLCRAVHSPARRNRRRLACLRLLQTLCPGDRYSRGWDIA
jgi:hypothetical protein